MQDLQKSLATMDREESKKFLKPLQDKPLKLTDDISNFIQLNCCSYMTFKYCSTLLEILTLVESLIRNDREDTWDLHMLRNCLLYFLLLMLQIIFLDVPSICRI